MTTTDPSYRQPRSAQRAMAGDCFHRIVRATRHESAVAAEQRAKQVLVYAQTPDQQLLHHLIESNKLPASAATSPRHSTAGRSFSDCLSRIRTSPSGNRAHFNRKASRTMRFTALRSTARGRKRRLTITPSRAPPPTFRTKAISRQPSTRFRTCNSRRNALLSQMRADFGKRLWREEDCPMRSVSFRRRDERGPWRAARGEPCGPRPSSCARESRACACA